MPKLERREAYYQNGKIDIGKTMRKTFSTDGLIGVVEFYDDGTRVVGAEGQTNPTPDDKKARIAYLRMQANLEYKSDGGDTLEIKELTRADD